MYKKVSFRSLSGRLARATAACQTRVINIAQKRTIFFTEFTYGKVCNKNFSLLMISSSLMELLLCPTILRIMGLATNWPILLIIGVIASLANCSFHEENSVVRIFDQRILNLCNHFLTISGIRKHLCNAQNSGIGNIEKRQGGVS